MRESTPWGLFGLTTVLGLAGALFASQLAKDASAIGGLMLAAAGLGLALLLTAMVSFMRESACGRRLLDLHRLDRVETQLY